MNDKILSIKLSCGFLQHFKEFVAITCRPINKVRYQYIILYCMLANGLRLAFIFYLDILNIDLKQSSIF